MLQSTLFGKTLREAPKDEVAASAKLLIRGGFINKEMAGVFTYLPLGLIALRNIESIIRDEINSIGGQEIFMPTLTSAENYKVTGREKLEILFKTKLHGGTDYILNQSHEEVVVPLAKNFIVSYKDLPLYVYQIQNKFRNEPRAKSGLIRAREFIMKDLYSFHAAEKDLDAYYDIVKKSYFRIFERMALKTVLTYASGGSFSKYSHEFQVMSPAGEDEIYLCKNCNVAVNKEIIEEQNVCPQCNNTALEAHKSIEVGNIFKLNTKFSRPFNLNFKDAGGKQNDIIMGCYGIGLGRVLATIVEMHHDGHGIIWPTQVAPFMVHLVTLGQNNAKVIKNSKDVYEVLEREGTPVLWDDRDISGGTKLNDADLVGMPIRLIVSDKTGDQIEWRERNSKTSTLVSLSSLQKKLDLFMKAKAAA